MTDWLEVNAIFVKDELILSIGPSAGAIQIEFAYFLTQNHRGISLVQRVHCAARYMSAPNVEKYTQTRINTLHSFLVNYAGCNHPRHSRHHSLRLDAIKNNIKGPNLDDYDDAEAKGSHNSAPGSYNEKKKSDEPSIIGLSKSIQMIIVVFLVLC